MDKMDLYKEFKHLYQPSAKEVAMVNVPPLNFLMVDGMGDPNHSRAYMDAIETLYSVSYTLKFMIKKGSEAIDYRVMPLEGLWWADDMTKFMENRDAWKWTMMIMQPDFITVEMVDVAIGEVRKKKNPPAIGKIRFENYHERWSAQIMHIGPFSEEGPTIEKVHQFIANRGRLTGKHHEIYLSDIRRVDPARWKTVIRQPMELNQV